MSRTPLVAVLALALALAAAACGRESAERAAARRSAHRDWCIAEELAVQANTQISTLDTLGSAGNTAVNEMLYPFARAYYDFAKARERELALMDSALAAPSAADSARYAEQAGRARPMAATTPAQENAARDYQRRFAEALGNPAHPCNRLAEGS